MESKILLNMKFGNTEWFDKFVHGLYVLEMMKHRFSIVYTPASDLKTTFTVIYTPASDWKTAFTVIYTPASDWKTAFTVIYTPECSRKTFLSHVVAALFLSFLVAAG